VIDKSQVLPLETIVRKRREDRGEVFLDIIEEGPDALGKT
jgi:hypothetical protein